MVAPVVTAQMGGDSGDTGLFWGTQTIPTAYVPGELLPADATVPDPPPVVTIISPAPGTAIARTGAFVFEVTSSAGITLQRILVRTGGVLAVWEQAYAEGAACAGFAVTRTAISGGFRYEVTRLAGWAAGGVEMEPLFGNDDAAAGVNT